MKTLIGLLPLVLHGAALLLAVGVTRCFGSGFGMVLALATYPVALVLGAGLVSRLVHRHVCAGRFDRDPSTPLYRGRMIYGAAWTSLYYCKPILHLVLSCPPLKALTFRLFGYRGSLEFTSYPDTWIRDLRLLDFGPGTYIANRATLGTNHVRSDGRIQIASITTGRCVIVGHLAMLGGGSRVGDESEIGVAAKVGFKVRIGARVSVGPNALVDSGTRLMDDVVIGASANIGKRCVIHAGVRVPAGAVLPDRAVIRTNADLERCLATSSAPLHLRVAS